MLDSTIVREHQHAAEQKKAQKMTKRSVVYVVDSEASHNGAP